MKTNIVEKILKTILKLTPIKNVIDVVVTDII